MSSIFPCCPQSNWWFFFAFLLVGNKVASALVNCTHGDLELGDPWCVRNYRSGSVCAPNGYCSNPFRGGCLQRILPPSKLREYSIELRACNSDDEEQGECTVSDYDEVRILSQDWEGPMFTSWIMQIILSEILRVPVTMETGLPGKDASMNFYDPQLRFSYSNQTYDYDAIRTSLEHGGCESFRAEQTEKGWHKTCADVIPELWSGQNLNIETYAKEGLIEPSTGAGGVAKYSWYVPKFTAERHYTLLSHFGMKEGSELEKRRRMAELFLRPRTWGFFCQMVSPDNCATPYYDEEGMLIAARPPQDDSEKGTYFSSGLYHGHFSASEENDCDANPTNCTGHFAIPPCSWTNYAVPQLHHIGIPVWSGGSQSASGSYEFGEMVGIYHAANFTKSNVLFYWFDPDPTIQQYMGTDAEFTPILLPQPTTECIKNRVTEAQRCSDNPADWIGEEVGSCDSESFSIQKVIVSDFYNRTYSRPKVDRSPAYDFLKSFRMSDLQLEDMYRRWYRKNNDRWNYDHREALCEWIGENLGELQVFLPPTYPRSFRTNEYDTPYLVVARVMSIIGAMIVLGTLSLVYYYRNKRSIVFAQRTFLYMILLGLFMVSIGSFLKSLPPSTATCMTKEWFVLVGYSLILVPLNVKISAINALVHSATSFRRAKITRRTLYKRVAIIIGIVIVYLTVWTILDPSTETSNKILTGEQSESGGEMVEIDLTCSSRASTWTIIFFIYVFLLIVAATVLAVQTRNIKQEFNESVKLGYVIYTIFLVELLLIIVWVVGPANMTLLSGTEAAATTSFLLSTNIIIVVAAYFFPKIISARKPESEQSKSNVYISTRTSICTTQRSTSRKITAIDGCGKITAIEN